jgi:hypothetical protein
MCAVRTAIKKAIEILWLAIIYKILKELNQKSSVVDDLVTVTLSVRVVAAAVLLPRPRSSATSNIIKRTPPTTQTHGAANQSVECVTVTVLLVLLVPEPDSEPLSWATITV